MATRKHHPEKVFIILSTTRGEIARDVNDLIENEEWKVPRFEPDDPRLTDEFCQSFADCTSEAHCEVDEIVDREYQHQRAVVACECDIELEDDDDDEDA